MTKSKAKMRGHIVQPGPEQLPVEPADPLAWMVNRLHTDEDGDPLMEGIFSNYNDDIVIEADSQTLIGRIDPERGPAQRIGLSDSFYFEDGKLCGGAGGERGPPGPQGVPGPPGPAGAATSRFFYRLDKTSTAASDPGAGKVRYNTAIPIYATELYFDNLTQEGFDPTTMFEMATFDDEFIIQDKDVADNFQRWRMTGPAIRMTGWFRLPVAFVNQNGASDFANNQELAVIVSARSETTGAAAPFDALAYNGLQINGGFEVGQEKGLAPTTNNGGYICDSWRLFGAGTVQVSAAIGGPQHFFPGYVSRCEIGVTGLPQTTLGAGDYISVELTIEGYRFARMAWGTFYAQPITIAFWSAHHRTGLYSGAVYNGDFNRSRAFTYTQHAADTPQYNVVNIPGDTTGAWNVGNGIGLGLIFTMACGTASIAPDASAWHGTGYIAAPGQVNAIASTQDAFRITGVSVLPGLEAPSKERSPYIMRFYPEEKMLCKRYWELAQGSYRCNVGSHSGTSVTFQVEKREVPLITWLALGPVVNDSPTFQGTYGTTVHSTGIQFQTTGGDIYNYGFSISADARF